MKTWVVIGLMSGTSLDGLDIVLCHFTKQPKKWKYKIIRSKTVPYPPQWKSKLGNADRLTGSDLVKLDQEYGAFLGQMVCDFLAKNQEDPDFIASHGHTVFHQPEKQITLQIGDGATLAAITGIKVISDFRSVDVALGGQGAPLVPVGDEFLFPEYDYCLNLGGIANLSYNTNGKRIAFDVCPVNIAINSLMEKVNLDVDLNGEKGRSGRIIPELLVRLNAIEYYQLKGPRSLGKEWFESIFLPITEIYDLPLSDLLRTIYEHVALQIGKAIPGNEKQTVLVSGGGAHNGFLIERIEANSPVQFIIPDKEIINYKEAVVFAFLGVLRDRNEVNCFASVTGASRNSIAGTVYAGKP
jgi:anhydro-N-acetylmuramic acid kinase